MNAHQIEEVRRRVAESEFVAAGWRELITRMQADGRDVTTACDLLKTLEHNLEIQKLKLGAVAPVG